MEYQDPVIHYKVDISLPPPVVSSQVKKERMIILKNNINNPDLERLSRNRECE